MECVTIVVRMRVTYYVPRTEGPRPKEPFDESQIWYTTQNFGIINWDTHLALKLSPPLYPADTKLTGFADQNSPDPQPHSTLIFSLSLSTPR